MRGNGATSLFCSCFSHLLDSSTKLPMMFLSKIESRQLVRKTSHNMTHSEIPPSPPLAPSWTTALTPNPPQPPTPHPPHPRLFAHSFPSAIWLKRTLTIKQKKNTCYSEHDSLPQRVPIWIARPPLVWSSLRPWDLQQNNCFRPKGVSILS